MLKFGTITSLCFEFVCKYLRMSLQKLDEVVTFSHENPCRFSIVTENIDIAIRAHLI